MTKTMRGPATASKKDAAKTAVKKSHKSLDDLLEDGLREIYSAEKQLLEAMPELEAACNSEDLQDAVRHHMDQTKRQVERLEKVFRRMDLEITGNESCP